MILVSTEYIANAASPEETVMLKSKTPEPLGKIVVWHFEHERRDVSLTL